MLRYLSAEHLHRYPYLRETMCQDAGRLNARGLVMGETRDPRSGQGPLYLLWQRGDGRHGGSMRFVPLSDCSAVWHCSRFCLSPVSDLNVAAALLLGAAEILDRFSLHHFTCSHDARFARICTGIGASPRLLTCNGAAQVCLWSPDAEAKARAARMARLTLAQSAMWFERAFPDCQDRKEMQIRKFTKRRP
ncbi:hypothetical protein [Thalassovita sp.]|uniref:hypothetical protein n=1 Tax=Thalassovita sp. TaxID=1979401 RepID=UPI002B278979|nr:hypothetical protein [Thalassovita sp.]